MNIYKVSISKNEHEDSNMYVIVADNIEKAKDTVIREESSRYGRKWKFGLMDRNKFKVETVDISREHIVLGSWNAG